MELTATYSPEDNKLRLYSSERLDKETYSRLKAAGFSWAPRQQLFVAPMWTPQRADLLMELCGEIGDEDKSLSQRAKERAERFENYSENRAKDAEDARKKVDAIVEHIPFGQPILIGHHSEKRARRDAERIGDGMRRSIKMWDTSKYWTERAEAAIQDAAYKERPDVRARRIKKIEADQRKIQRYKSEAERFIKSWSKPGLTMQEAATIASYDHSKFSSPTEARPGGTSLWDATQGRYEPQPKVEEIAAKAIQSHEKIIAWANRWLEHYGNRLAYERAMLVADGGLETDKTKPQVGGACKCLWSPRGGWSLIQKVNRTSVTILANYGNPERNFTRTRPFDKLTAVMSRAEVDAAREAGLILEENKIGFILRSKPSQTEAVSEPAKPVQEEPKVAQPPAILSGIQTPRGPLPHSQQELFKPQAGQSQKRGIGL
ncbi:MAG: DUF3560 domain-containing protein [Terrimicrobiaceae bacterium]|nr:DUF3560 domain-containing protein [Terrimicrobiaceae bacterium]